MDKKGASKLIILYSFFSKWKFTKKSIKKLEKKFAILMPSDKSNINKKTMKTFLIMWGIDLIMILFLFILKPSIYSALLTLLFIYICNSLYINSVVDKLELKLLKQLDKWIKDVRHKYQVHEMIDEAIYDTIEETKYPMKLHVQKIFKVLESDDIEMEAEKYNADVANRFLKTFLAICILIQNFGDKKIEEQSLFLTNLKYLRQEIEIEVINKEKTKILFSGLTFLSICPILATRWIEKWAISSFEGLNRFYNGKSGIIILSLIFLSTIFAFKTIIKLRGKNEIEIEEHFYLKILLKNKKINFFIKAIINKYYGKYIKINRLLKNSGEFITGKEFLLKRILYSLAGFLLTCILFIYIHIKTKNFVFYWHELIISTLVSMFSYYIPYIILVLMQSLKQMQMEDEVIQFHSIILMLMHIDRMTIEIILKWMESFSKVFKISLQKTINNLELGEIEALENLKKDQPFEGFVRIIENIEMCDRIPIHKAFDEIAIERLNYQEKRKLENEKYTQNKAVIAKAIGWIPFSITIGLYLIVPFIVEGLSQLLNSIGEITNN